MKHKISMMNNNNISETRVKELANTIIQNPDLSMTLRKKYSEMSGISLEYTDLLTAIRGLGCLGLIR